MEGFGWLLALLLLAVVLLYAAQQAADAQKSKTYGPKVVWLPKSTGVAASEVSGYHAYTTEFDVVRCALHTSEQQTIVQRLDARRRSQALRAMTMSAQSKSKHGLRRLQTEVAAAKGNSHIALSLLLDLSGSMRFPVAHAEMEFAERPNLADMHDLKADSCGAHMAMVVKLLSEICDCEEVPFEILGFTTSLWRGGNSRLRWIDEGRISAPGRLNDVLYVVFKAFDQSFNEREKALSVLLDPTIYKENIDGEAVDWATSRLEVRPEPRRILIIFSDGAPVDDSTLSENDDKILHDHLIKTIEQIIDAGRVELCAVGIGNWYARYYKRSASLTADRGIDDQLFEEILEFFKLPSRR